MKKRMVRIRAPWSSSDVQAEVSLRREFWSRVLRGEEYSACSYYYYEGVRFTAFWDFNSRGPGRLVVSYDGNGVGFDGLIASCRVVENG